MIIIIWVFMDKTHLYVWLFLWLRWQMRLNFEHHIWILWPKNTKTKFKEFIGKMWCWCFTLEQLDFLVLQDFFPWWFYVLLGFCLLFWRLMCPMWAHIVERYVFANYILMQIWAVSKEWAHMRAKTNTRLIKNVQLSTLKALWMSSILRFFSIDAE